MSELLALKVDKYTFVISTKEVERSRQRLKQTLARRGKDFEPSKILFSPPLVINDDFPTPWYPTELPVFFENKDYHIEFVFDEQQLTHPFIEHRLKKVEESFNYSPRTKTLRATINTENHIGWFKMDLCYQLDDRSIKQSISIEILPTKMDMHSDLAVMNADIDSQFPLWRFSLAEKTQQQMQAVKQPQAQFLLLWLALFEDLFADMQLGLRHIVNAPHSRLIETAHTVKMDRLKGKLSVTLEQAVINARGAGLHQKRFLITNKKLSVDTPENRFIKFVMTTSVATLVKITDAQRQKENSPDKQRLSASFYDKLNSWKTDMQRFQKQPLFDEVGSFKSLERESLVLQQKPGYAKVYKAWQQLKWYLDALHGTSSLSIRSVAKLYEVWCFLDVRRILLDLDFQEVQKTKNSLVKIGTEVILQDGIQGAFEFERKDGVKLTLAHEPVFSVNGKNIRSWIKTQEPDIFLEASFPDGAKFVWLFDAKYRIATPHSADGGDDKVPKDAIDQMHRYRDALIRLEEKDGKIYKTRPVFGAYCLYPGSFDQAKDDNPYEDAIKQIGIGAFSLLPSEDQSGSVWLHSFLKDKLPSQTTGYPLASSDRYFLEEPSRIPYYGTRVTRYSDLVIIANQLGPFRNRDYIKRFEDGKAQFYHVKANAFNRQEVSHHMVHEARYLTVGVDADSVQSREICFIYPILSARQLARSDISDHESGANELGTGIELYWLFELGEATKLKEKVVLGINDRFELKFADRKAFDSNIKWADLAERYSL